MSKGLWTAVGAYAVWGFLPMYWKLLRHVPAPQLLSHRIVWSCLTLLAALGLMQQLGRFRSVALRPRTIGIYTVAALIIGVNWLTYVWAVNAGFIIETSLGYFINPLLSVLLGVVFLRERMRPGQWAAIGLAAAGVLYLTLNYGSLPWIALTLACSFAVYGLVKKIAPLNSLDGLTLETGLLFVPALLYLAYSEWAGVGVFGHADLTSDLITIGAGLATTIPLLMFASAAQKIPLSAIGILQYIAPTLQFLIGRFIYQEPFSTTSLIGFSIVWVALFIYATESVWVAQRAKSIATV